jgi:aryl-alcohol dehydrogenase-like predicted oxidoreductase
LRRGDLIEALLTVQQSGKTRYIGYSGDGFAARYAVQCGAFHTLQTSINIADQEAVDLTLPLARQGNIGVIAKRPVANVIWNSKSRPKDPYKQPYWDRLNKLDYGFLKDDLGRAVGVSLLFTLGVPGVHTAIVGTTRPGRWQENAKLLTTYLPEVCQFEKIRERWVRIADSSWKGEN